MAGEDFEIVGKIIVDDTGAISIRGIGDEIDKVTQRSSGLGAETSGLGAIMGYVWSAIILAGVVAVAGAVVDVSQKVVGFVGEATMLASRLEQLNIVVHQMGTIAGYSNEYVDQVVQSVQDMGIQADVSTQTVIEFIKANMDLADASAIARVAQDAAVISGKNSSEVTEQIVYGISKMNTLVLANAGIMIDSKSAYTAYALELGKAVTELTVADKQQAFLNATLAYGEMITGSYSLSMENAYKQTGSFERYIYEAKIAVGEFFVPALNEGVFAAKDLLKAFVGMVEEGGALNPFIKSVAEGVTAIAVALADGVTAMLEFVKVFSADYELGGWALAIENADLSIAGIIDGMTNAILIWMAGDGPQELADNLIAWIDKVGTGGVFLSKTLEAANRLLAAVGEALVMVDWAEVGVALDRATGRMIDNVAWNEAGLALHTAIKTLFGLIGQADPKTFYDDDEWVLRILLPGIWTLKNTATGNALTKGISDFVAGAFGYTDWDALGVDFAAGLEYALVAGFGYMRYEDLAADFALGWQSVLDFGEDTAKAVADWWTELWANFALGVDYVATAVGNWWTELWANFALGIDYVATAVGDWWTELWANFNLGVATVGQAITDQIHTWINNAFTNMEIDKEAFLAQWADIFNSLGQISDKVIASIVTWWTTLWSNFSLGVDYTVTAISKWWDDVWSGFTGGLDVIATWWNTLWSNFSLGVDAARTAFSTWWTTLWGDFALGVGVTVAALGTWWDGVWSSFTVATAPLVTWWNTLWSNFSLGVGATKTALTNWWTELWSNFALGWSVVRTAIGTAINTAIDNFTVGWSYLTDIGKGIIDGIVSGIRTTTGALVQGVTDAIQTMLNKVKSMLGIASPSSIFAGFGENLVQGLIDGWTEGFATWVALIQSGIDGLINLFPDWLQNALGLDGGGSTSGGSTGGGSTGGSGGTGGTTGGAQTVNNYFYGPVYFASSLDATNYDCPSPNPINSSTSNIVGGLAGGT